MKRQPTEVRRQQIAEAALTIIARDGARRFTTASIAREVGLAEGTIFRHFKDKPDIIDAAIRYLEVLMFPADAPPPPTEPLAELRAFLTARITLLQEHPGYLRVLFSNEISHAVPGLTLVRLHSLRERSVGTILRCLKQARAAGAVRDDLSLQSLFMLIHGMLLSQVFSGPQLAEQLGFSRDPDVLWQSVEKLMTVA